MSYPPVSTAQHDSYARFIHVAVCPMCAPWLQPRGLCRCNMHVNHAMLAPHQMDAMPSQREGQGFESP